MSANIDDTRSAPPVAKGGGLPRLGRRALPALEDGRGAPDQVLRAEELQHLVLLRGALAPRARHPGRHRHLPDDELQAGRGARVHVGRVHHARRQLRLADPLHALHGGVDVLRRRLPAHVPRADLRLLQEAARAPVGVRHADLRGADGRGLHGLPPALGADELLGRAGHHLPVRRDPVRHRRRADDLAQGRLHRLRRDAEPLLRAARHRRAARADRPRRRPHPRAARGRLEQPRRHRDQGEQECRRHSRRTASRSTRTTRSRTSWSPS